LACLGQVCVLDLVFFFGWVSFTIGGLSFSIGDQIYTVGGQVLLAKGPRSICGSFIFLEGANFILLGVKIDYWTNLLSGQTHLAREGRFVLQ
jgi:hypothetical protein